VAKTASPAPATRNSPPTIPNQGERPLPVEWEPPLPSRHWLAPKIQEGFRRGIQAQTKLVTVVDCILPDSTETVNSPSGRSLKHWCSSRQGIDGLGDAARAIVDTDGSARMDGSSSWRIESR